MSRDDLRGMSAVMARRAQLASVLLLGCVSLALAADKTAEQLNELGDEFLEYLGTLEADEESWLDVIAASTTSPAQSSKSGGDDKVVASASSSSASSQSQALPRAASANPDAASQTGKVEQ